MPRHKEGHIGVSLHIKETLNTRLENICEVLNKTKAGLIRDALRAYCRELEQEIACEVEDA